MVVVGGWASGYTSSVLTRLPGAEDWTSLDSLPIRALGGARASIVGGRLRVAGGYDGYFSRSEVLAHEIVV